MTDFAYRGRELEIFEKAVHWKRYFSSRVAPYIRGDVLEVGSGLGANLMFFSHLPFHRWICLEPDRDLAARLTLPDKRYQAVTGTIEDLPDAARGRPAQPSEPASSPGGFDTILYIDVLEHTEDDRAELLRASARLNPGGCVIVLAPAHPWLFTPFDSAIGHFRRYTKASLAACAPRGLRCEKLIYLDIMGLAASAANRLVLKSAMPTHGQIQFWDRVLVPISRFLIDPILAHGAGKSILGVWRRPL
jgi:SAM-dependent methyltransferase